MAKASILPTCESTSPCSVNGRRSPPKLMIPAITPDESRNTLSSCQKTYLKRVGLTRLSVNIRRALDVAKPRRDHIRQRLDARLDLLDRHHGVTQPHVVLRQMPVLVRTE